MIRHSLISVAFLMNLGVCLLAQTPIPAPLQDEPILLRGGTIHQGNGQVIENGIISFDNGKITFVGSSDNYRPQGKTFKEYDVTGKEVYPGMIMCNSVLGLSEVDAIKATKDFQETGDFNPSVRSLIAYNTDSERIPVSRSNGILLAQIVPQGGTVSGLSSVVNLDAWNWEDAVFKVDEGIQVHWPSKFRPPIWMMGETEMMPNENYEKTMQMLEKNLRDANAYAQHVNPGTKNLKMEAMKGLFNGKTTLYLHVNKAAEIIKGIQFLQQFNVQKIVLVGASDAYYVKEFIREYEIPVILRLPHNLPTRPEEDVAHPYKLPFLLASKGILVALDMEAGGGITHMQNLPFLAGTASAYGLSKDEALQLVTRNPAKILGIDDRVGTLEQGKDATLVVSNGDLLDMRSNQVQIAFIEGRKVDLDNKHKRLYRKFSSKYN